MVANKFYTHQHQISSFRLQSIESMTFGGACGKGMGQFVVFLLSSKSRFHVTVFTSVTRVAYRMEKKKRNRNKRIIE